MSLMYTGLLLLWVVTASAVCLHSSNTATDNVLREIFTKSILDKNRLSTVYQQEGDKRLIICLPGFKMERKKEV